MKNSATLVFKSFKGTSIGLRAESTSTRAKIYSSSLLENLLLLPPAQNYRNKLLKMT